MKWIAVARVPSSEPRAASPAAGAASGHARGGRRRETYVLYCDDSGGEDDALRSAASVSGPARVLLALERELRRVLRVAGMEELKWVGLRTREPRLQAA